MNLYIFGKGNCRGHQWLIRHETKVEEVVTLINKAIALKEIFDTKYDEYIESLYDEGKYDDSIIAIVTGSECIPDEFGNIDKMRERIKMLLNGQGFVIEREESTFGVGITKKDAVLAFAIPEEDMWLEE